MTNLLGRKIGMTQVFDEVGNVVPVTVVEAGPCVVTQLKTVEKDGYSAVQLGLGQARRLNKPQQGHLKSAKSAALREFRLEKADGFQVGQELKADIFKVNDLVAVTGTSIGKGFQGTIKRYHTHRGPMSHGSKSHRIPGSIGAGTTPGRVFPGRKMPGHMGAVRVTQPSLRVVGSDPEKNLLLLSGSVPGKYGNLVMISKTGEYTPAARQGKEEPKKEKGKK